MEQAEAEGDKVSVEGAEGEGKGWGQVGGVGAGAGDEEGDVPGEAGALQEVAGEPDGGGASGGHWGSFLGAGHHDREVKMVEQVILATLGLGVAVGMVVYVVMVVRKEWKR